MIRIVVASMGIAILGGIAAGGVAYTVIHNKQEQFTPIHSNSPQG